MISSEKYIYKNNNFCESILKEIFEKKYLKDFQYVGGTIFLCKEIFDTSIKLFSKYLKVNVYNDILLR